MSNEEMILQTPSRVLRVKPGDLVWFTHDWKGRGIFSVVARLVHDNHVKLGDKWHELGKTVFLEEREARVAAYEHARRSLEAMDAAYSTKRRKLAAMVDELAKAKA